jgi:hypothetical protein
VQLLLQQLQPLQHMVMVLHLPQPLLQALPLQLRLLVANRPLQ